MKFLDVVARAKASQDFNVLNEAIPYARFLGFRVEVVDGEPVSKLPFDDKLIGNPALPALHGGVVGAILEHAALIHLIWELETAHLPKIINISIDYLRAGRPLDTYAGGVVTRRGRRVANVRVEAWQNDRSRPIAHAHAHFLLG